MLGAASIGAYFTWKGHFSLPASVLAGALVGMIYFICIRRQVSGMSFIIFFSSLFALPGRFLYIVSPIGIIVELFTYGLWLNILHDQLSGRKVTHIFRNNLITIAMGCLLLYYVLELANPSMTSKVGWFFFIRKQISFLLFYYVAYSVFDSYRQVKNFLIFCFVLVLLVAMYGVKQQWLGMAIFESRWLIDDHMSYMLFFQGGFLRKFSFLTDPAAFGIICSSFGLLSIVLAIRTVSNTSKIQLYIISLICLSAASYSGTRTCILMLVSGLIMYSMMTLNEKRTYILIATSVVVTVILLFGPLQNNPVVTRIKTGLQGSHDPSAILRVINRRMIQPYIHTHPVGGGLNTSSLEGKLYNPNHALAGFPPDSGYMKILLEQGWIGLFFHLIFYFLVIKRGIDCYFGTTNENIKNIYIAVTVCLFSMIVGQYSQITIAQYPLILIYYAFLAILVRLADFDVQQPQRKQAIV